MAENPICKKCPAVLEQTIVDYPHRILVGANAHALKHFEKYLEKLFPESLEPMGSTRWEWCTLKAENLCRLVISRRLHARMRKHGTRQDPETGEPRQRWRCKANHVLMENARPRVDPDRRRPPPCPVIVDGKKRCGEERIWWCTKPELRASCRIHGRRRLTDEEIAAHEAGQPYPEPLPVFKPKMLKKVKI